jgi:hypothetical protein
MEYSLHWQFLKERHVTHIQKLEINYETYFVFTGYLLSLEVLCIKNDRVSQHYLWIVWFSDDNEALYERLNIHSHHFINRVVVMIKGALDKGENRPEKCDKAI